MVTRILAPRTRPHAARIERRHSPTSKRGALSYSQFKDCLRWDFGFTCAICLLHEHHLVLPGTGADKTGQMTVEHIVIKSTPEGAPLENEYENCLWVCRFCNGKRGDRHLHVKEDGTRLLNPIMDVWTDHFDLVEDQLVPRSGDRDAEYTRDAYGINESMRVERRKALAELIEDQRSRLTSEQARVEQLDAEIPCTDTPEREELVTERGRAAKRWERALKALTSLSGVPNDRPSSCRCQEIKMEVHSAISEGWQDLPNTKLPPPPWPPKRRFRV